eukprot:401720-Rhodomonas_salina.1
MTTAREAADASDAPSFPSAQPSQQDEKALLAAEKRPGLGLRRVAGGCRCADDHLMFLTNLTDLSLASNELEVLPLATANLRKLRFLRVSANRITSLHKDVVSCLASFSFFLSFLLGCGVCVCVLVVVVLCTLCGVKPQHAYWNYRDVPK